MVSALNILFVLTLYFCIHPEPFRVAFDQTMYTVLESAGSVEVCVNLTHPPDDILDEQVTVLVFHNDDSMYIPPNSTLASKQLHAFAVTESHHSFQLLTLLWVYSIGTI